VAGLAAARSLVTAGYDVTVLEAAPQWGGKLASTRPGGVRLDSGAESVLARRPEALALIHDLGLDDRLVHPTAAAAQVLVGGEVRRLPPSAMGVPRDLDALAGYLSREGLDRARQEPELPAPAFDDDLGIGAYVDARFGPEVTDRLLEPLLGGVYAGQSRLLSFEAVSPALFARACRGGSLLEHAQQSTVTSAHGPVFAGLVGGVATLADALVADLLTKGATLRTGVTVRELSPLRTGTTGGYRLLCGPTTAPELIDCDAVVLATPAGPAGRLLTGLAAVGHELAAVPYASTAVLTLVLRGARLTGSGLLVPPGELPTIKALTYSSNKWAWVADAAQHAWGTDASVVRVSVGRLGEEGLLQLDDDALLARTWTEARRLPGWAQAELVTGEVARWGGALPQYLVGHRVLVGRVRAAERGWPGLALCGAALDGVGVAACLAGATAAADKIDQDLSGGSPARSPATELPSPRQLAERNLR
jgi:oxygen-dependent protoporphyrinogen oxidase